MIINIIILLFYALILPFIYITYIFIIFVTSWLFYVIKYLKLREDKRKEKKDELESIDE